MTAKEYLERYELLQVIIDQRKHQLKSIEDDERELKKNLICIDRTVIKAEIRAVLHIEYKELNTIKHRVNTIDNDLYREILKKIYLERIDLFEVSEILSYSYDYIKHIHVKALKYFENTYPDIKSK